MESIRWYRVQGAYGAYNLELCYRHVWELRLAGVCCLPISRALLDGRGCHDCFLDSEAEYYDQLNNSFARMHGA